MLLFHSSTKMIQDGGGKTLRARPEMWPKEGFFWTKDGKSDGKAICNQCNIDVISMYLDVS